MYREMRIPVVLLFYVLFNSLALIPLRSCGQEWMVPVGKSILLSGNFGELRATHFHSGIDIRTGGVEGLPVVCVKDGYLVRVSVSPVGYGQAMYIEHADGTTSVYGHLQRFVPVVAEIVRSIQYEKEHFQVDEDFREYRLFFKQGDTIAYSGNTGSSGGPHLHFEIRNTASERAINPLSFYSIRDRKAPSVKSIYLYAVSGGGCADLLKRVGVKVQGGGRYGAGTVGVPEGKDGVGVYATDYMEDSWNKLGVYRMTLVADSDTLFELSMDSCSFEQACLINEVKDFDAYKKKETVYRCFGNYQHRFLGIRNRNGGYIEVEKDSLVKVNIVLEDKNMNRSEVSLLLKGVEARQEAEAGIVKYDKDELLELPGCRVELPAGSLFSSVRKRLRVEKDTLTGRDIFVLSEREVPLFHKAHLFLSGDFGVQDLIYEVASDGRKYVVETVHTDAGLKAEINYLSRYAVVKDEQAPEITFLGKFQERALRFRIKDKLSGIKTYRGEVNGKWCLFSYDPRVDLLQCSLEEPVFQKGRINEVRIEAVDRAGNKNELIVKVKK